VEGAVLLAEPVLDLKRLRERCWLKCGRGMVGLHVSGGRMSGVVRALRCLGFVTCN
jgi:hypothetical protein